MKYLYYILIIEILYSCHSSNDKHILDMIKEWNNKQIIFS